jgi:hypothetical protein
VADDDNAPTRCGNTPAQPWIESVAVSCRMPMTRSSVLLLVLAACGDDAAAIDAGTTSDASSELDCPGVFDCVTLCADGDDPCVEACVGRGSAPAVALVNDVLACAQRNACTDEACLSMRCGPELLACAGTPADGGVGDGATGCDGTGKPEMTGPITGLEPSYLRGDPIDIGVPVDEDTARVIVGIYQVGTTLYLGGTAEDAAPSSTRTLSFFAGVAGGKTGTFYLSVELCSTSVCTTPFVRNTYQRADRTAPMLAPGETYAQTRELVGGPAMPETCATTIPIRSFTIE